MLILYLILRYSLNETTKFTPLEIKGISYKISGIQSKKDCKQYANPANTSNEDHEVALR